MKYTKQEAYDKAARHILAQGKPSLFNGNCMYRSPDGKLQCAFGPFIPDDKYHPDFELRTARSLLSGTAPVVDTEGYDYIRNGKKKIQYHPPLDIEVDGLDNEERTQFFVELQRAHDNAAEASAPDINTEALPFIDEYKQRMLDVAKIYDLDATVLTQ